MPLVEVGEEGKCLVYQHFFQVEFTCNRRMLSSLFFNFAVYENAFFIHIL